MIGCNNKTRLDWVLGLVVSLSPGSDGCAQVVRVKSEDSPWGIDQTSAMCLFIG